MWADLHRGILEDFVEVAMFSKEDTEKAFWEYTERHRAQSRKDAKAYRLRQAGNVVWLEKERIRKAAWRSKNRAHATAYTLAWKKANRDKVNASKARRKAA